MEAAWTELEYDPDLNLTLRCAVRFALAFLTPDLNNLLNWENKDEDETEISGQRFKMRFHSRIEIGYVIEGEGWSLTVALHSGSRPGGVWLHKMTGDRRQFESDMMLLMLAGY